MKNLALIILAVAAAATCSSTNAKTDLGNGLPLPQVPDSLTAPTDRANYVVTHFWDEMDFTNRRYALDDFFMEQAFANYAQVLPIANVDSAAASIATLLIRSSADADVRSKLIDISTLYLYEPDSPVYNEDMFALFAKAILYKPDLADEAQLARADYQLEMIRKNAPGSIPSDFEFVDRTGLRQTLHNAISGTTSLLIFYDPDCEDCHKAMGILNSEEGVSKRISDGSLRIIAIADAETMDKWKQTAGNVPAAWSDGRHVSYINDKGLYEIRHTPTFYLIDSQGRILLKDKPLGTVLGSLLENSQP